MKQQSVNPDPVEGSERLVERPLACNYLIETLDDQSFYSAGSIASQPKEDE